MIPLILLIVLAMRIYLASGQRSRWKHGNQLWMLYMRKMVFSFASLATWEGSQTIVCNQFCVLQFVSLLH